MTKPNMTRPGPVLLFLLTIFISSLPRERYSVTSCGGMVHLPLLALIRYCKPGLVMSVTKACHA